VSGLKTETSYIVTLVTPTGDGSEAMLGRQLREYATVDYARSPVSYPYIDPLGFYAGKGIQVID
jgi:hypothetical protein